MGNSSSTPYIASGCSRISEIEKRGDWASQLIKRYEPRARKKDYAQALSFEAHDPMWMLTRQWQFGRFKGEDCGSAISTQVVVTSRTNNIVYYGQDTTSRYHVLQDPDLVEPLVESFRFKMTLYDKVEAATHLTKMLRSQKKFPQILEALREKFPLELNSSEEDDPIHEIADSVNDKKKRFLAVYADRSFDGEKAYFGSIAAILDKYIAGPESSRIWKEYNSWFANKYHVHDSDVSFWDSEKLAYDFSLGVGTDMYSAENYSTGHVGWYTFDKAPVKGHAIYEKKYTEFFGYLPAKATFPAAPARRLWEYENYRVQFGNLSNDDVSQLASAVMMEYVAMYSNDWMMIPVHTKAGRLINVEHIVVNDTFGDVQMIGRTPEKHDNQAPEVPFTDRWALFSNTRSDAYAANDKKGDFRTVSGLFLPASLLRVSESEPIEEVQFLRDEMANMVWGVEKRIDDECGGSLDGKTMSDKVLTAVDSHNGPEVRGEEKAEFKYLIQNRVPVNWIPFVPLPESGAMGREIRFRRGRMPIYINDGSKDKFKWVRPSTSVLAVKRDQEGKIIPFYLNEEEILGYGTKVTLTNQQTRWLNGVTYTWRGFAKKISGYQANSGLMFDELRQIHKQNAREDKEQRAEELKKEEAPAKA